MEVDSFERAYLHDVRLHVPPGGTGVEGSSISSTNEGAAGAVDKEATAVLAAVAEGLGAAGGGAPYVSTPFDTDEGAADEVDATGALGAEAGLSSLTRWVDLAQPCGAKFQSKEFVSKREADDELNREETTDRDLHELIKLHDGPAKQGMVSFSVSYRGALSTHLLMSLQQLHPLRPSWKSCRLVRQEVSAGFWRAE